MSDNAKLFVSIFLAAFVGFTSGLISGATMAGKSVVTVTHESKPVREPIYRYGDYIAIRGGFYSWSFGRIVGYVEKDLYEVQPVQITKYDSGAFGINEFGTITRMHSTDFTLTDLFSRRNSGHIH